MARRHSSAVVIPDHASKQARVFSVAAMPSHHTVSCKKGLDLVPQRLVNNRFVLTKMCNTLVHDFSAIYAIGK